MAADLRAPCPPNGLFDVTSSEDGDHAVIFETTNAEGPLLIKPMVHGDARGFFLESFREDLIRNQGLDLCFVQDNHSRSTRGVIRGMHFQPGQWKLVRCARGTIVDVIVDVRAGSPTFGKWQSFMLDDVDHHQLLVPDGFAHGFCVTSDVADVTYKVSSYYDPGAESGFAFDDPAVAIEWPIGSGEMQVSQRDRDAPALSDLLRPPAPS